MANRILDTQRSAGGNAILDAGEAGAPAGITAAAAWTEGSETFALVGNVDPVSVSASAAWTEGSEAFVLTGAVVAPPVTAAAAWTEGSETFQAVGEVAPPITATAAWVEGSETFAMAGTVSTPIEIGTMSFTPSATRTVSVGAGSKPFTAGELWNMSDPKKPRAPKDPDATTDYSFNWTPWLLDVVDSISDHEILTTEGLVDLGSSAVGSVITVFLSAGTPAKRAEVTCRITTSSTPPRIEDRTIFLDIESR